MSNQSDIQSDLDAARELLEEHMQYCPVCKRGEHCGTRAELEQLIRLSESWLKKQG